MEYIYVSDFYVWNIIRRIYTSVKIIFLNQRDDIQTFVFN